MAGLACWVCDKPGLLERRCLNGADYLSPAQRPTQERRRICGDRRGERGGQFDAVKLNFTLPDSIKHGAVISH